MLPKDERVYVKHMDEDIVWETVTKDLAPLILELEKIL